MTATRPLPSLIGSLLNANVMLADVAKSIDETADNVALLGAVADHAEMIRLAGEAESLVKTIVQLSAMVEAVAVAALRLHQAAASAALTEQPLSN